MAQLVPFQAHLPNALRQHRGTEGFGSTGEPEVSWALDTGQRKPALQIQVLRPQNQPKFWTRQLLVDTGAVVTIISSKDWPSSWPLVNPAHGLVGVGGTSTTMQRAVTLKCKNPHGYVCAVHPLHCSYTS